MVQNSPLIDKFGRRITKLRISVISACNRTCPYCHEEGYYMNGNNNKLTIKQALEIAELIKKYGITRVKLTGGEPLLHDKISEIISIFKQIKTLKDISLTTNGLLLEEKAEDLRKAGLDRLNIGCDSLHNSNVKNQKPIEAGIKKALKLGFNPIKINMVVLKGINENEINDMIDYTKKNGLVLQLIELIDSDKEFYKKYHMNLDKIEEEIAKSAVESVEQHTQGRIQYILRDGAVIEFVKPMHNPEFCKKCKTLRITNDFSFQPCLKRRDNIVPINGSIDHALLLAMERRRPFYTEKNIKR